jgi:solute carrier family 20 (sodium-dependent phosphate transporter)
MANLGNRVTLMSPSRGFSMELGSVISIVIATRLSEYTSRTVTGLL